MGHLAHWPLSLSTSGLLSRLKNLLTCFNQGFLYLPVILICLCLLIGDNLNKVFNEAVHVKNEIWHWYIKWINIFHKYLTVSARVMKTSVWIGEVHMTKSLYSRWYFIIVSSPVPGAELGSVPAINVLFLHKLPISNTSWWWRWRLWTMVHLNPSILSTH